MARIIPWDEIGRDRARGPQGIDLPDFGTYHVRIENFEETVSRANRAEFRARSRILAPKAYQGMVVFDNFYIGNADDPTAEDPQSSAWRNNWHAERFRDFVDKAKVENRSQDFDILCQQLPGHELVLNVEMKTDDGVRKKPDGTEYVDEEAKARAFRKQNITEYFAVGEREPAVPNGGMETPEATEPRVVKPAPVQPAKREFVLEE